VDVAAEQTLTIDQILQLRREWQETGFGRIFSSAGTTVEFLFIQLNPDRAMPSELGRDARIRRGLFVGVDRQTLADTFYPGFDLVANTFMAPTDPRNTIIGKPYAAYPFDREAALRALAEAGWVRDGSGRLLRQDGHPVEVTVRADAARTARLAVLADGFRQLGMTVNEEIAPPTQQLTREYRASFSFTDWSSRGIDEMLRILTRPSIPTAQNNWNGANYGSYSSAPFDGLADRFFATVEADGQAAILREVGNLFTTDWPIMPLQHSVTFTAVRKGVHTLEGKDGSWDPWNSYLWATG
jgi:ABC-type transport system substrate-binding protein